MESVIIYTDGGCSGNPGPGGWAFAIHLPANRQVNHGANPAMQDSRDLGATAGPIEIEGSGGEANTTNNRMELRAVISALEAVEAGSIAGPVVVRTDSQYVKNGITSWIAAWKRNGWRTADKKPVKNRELWEELDAVASRVKPGFEWVKGHAGVEGNERCDALVQEEIAKFR